MAARTVWICTRRTRGRVGKASSASTCSTPGARAPSTARERAALAWTEAVTLVAESRVPDAVYEEARRQFSDDDLLALTMAVATINAWNRLNVALRTVPGRYQPGMFDAVDRDATRTAAD